MLMIPLFKEILYSKYTNIHKPRGQSRGGGGHQNDHFTIISLIY